MPCRRGGSERKSAGFQRKVSRCLSARGIGVSGPDMDTGRTPQPIGRLRGRPHEGRTGGEPPGYGMKVNFAWAVIGPDQGNGKSRCGFLRTRTRT